MRQAEALQRLEQVNARGRWGFERGALCHLMTLQTMNRLGWVELHDYNIRITDKGRAALDRWRLSRFGAARKQGAA